MSAGNQVNVNSEWDYIMKGAASYGVKEGSGLRLKRAVGMPNEVDYCETDEQLV